MGYALDQGRTAISMGGKTGNREDNRNKLRFTIANRRWGKCGMRGNCCAAAQMSRSAAIHGTLGVIRSRGESRVGLLHGRTMVLMVPMHGAITVVCRYRMA